MSSPIQGGAHHAPVDFILSGYCIKVRRQTQVKMWRSCVSPHPQQYIRVLRRSERKTATRRKAVCMWPPRIGNVKRHRLRRSSQRFGDEDFRPSRMLPISVDGASQDLSSNWTQGLFSPEIGPGQGVTFIPSRSQRRVVRSIAEKPTRSSSRSPVLLGPTSPLPNTMLHETRVAKTPIAVCRRAPQAAQRHLGLRHARAFRRVCR
jgi:hypothetical protein